MKKYVIKYTDSDGKEMYGNSVDEKGCTYSLVSNIKNASKYYGKNALKSIQHRLDLDKKYRNFLVYDYTITIKEIDEEPLWYFEIDYAISKYHKGSTHKPIPKRYLKLMNTEDKQKILAEHKKYPNWKNPDVIMINELWNLGVEALTAYYNWRKEHYKGKPVII